MAEYKVIWEIDLDAGNAVEAARLAQALQRDEGSTANFFTVQPSEDTDEYHIDLDDPSSIEAALEMEQSDGA